MKTEDKEPIFSAFPIPKQIRRPVFASCGAGPADKERGGAAVGLRTPAGKLDMLTHTLHIEELLTPAP